MPRFLLDSYGGRKELRDFAWSRSRPVTLRDPSTYEEALFFSFEYAKEQLRTNYIRVDDEAMYMAIFVPTVAKSVMSMGYHKDSYVLLPTERPEFLELIKYIAYHDAIVDKQMYEDFPHLREEFEELYPDVEQYARNLVVALQKETIRYTDDIELCTSIYAPEYARAYRSV